MKFVATKLQIAAMVCACGFAAPAPAIAQTQQAPREAVAAGAIVTPALEGGGPWLLAGAKVNSRLTERFGLSVEADRIWGSKNQFSELTQSYTASMLIYSRRASDDRTASYWFVGPQLIRGRHFKPAESTSHSALTIGHGWSQLSGRHLRVAGEIGFSGGDGYMVFGSVVVQAASVK
jgi:hypothetical protein